MAIKATELSLKDAYLQLRDIKKVYMTGGIAGMPKPGNDDNKMGLNRKLFSTQMTWLPWDPLSSLEY